VSDSGFLEIKRAEIRDAGIYICVAQNSAGTALGQIVLEVQGNETTIKLVCVTFKFTIQCRPQLNSLIEQWLCQKTVTSSSHAKQTACLCPESHGSKTAKRSS
jgi:hypothetical protein